MSHSTNQKQFITGKFSTLGVSTSHCDNAEAFYSNEWRSIHCGLWVTCDWCFPMMGCICVNSLIEKDFLQCLERNWSYSHGVVRFHVSD